MRKKITLLLGAALITTALSAQTLKLSDFEDGVTNFFTHASGGLTYTIVPNPHPEGLNLSSKVLKLDYEGTGKALARDWSRSPDNGPSSFTVGEDAGQYRYAHIKVWKSFTSQIQWQFRTSSGSGTGYANASNTTTDQWEYIVFDLMNGGLGSYNSGDSYPGFHIFLAYQYTAQSTYTAYIDDVYLSNSSEPIQNQGTGITATPQETSKISVTKSLSGNSLVHVTGITGNLKLEVFNLQGQKLATIVDGKSTSNAYTLPSLPRGIYILKATTANGVQSIKF
jgi:hypothetical protein